MVHMCHGNPDHVVGVERNNIIVDQSMPTAAIVQ